MTGRIMISGISILVAAAAFVNANTFPGGTSDGVPGAGVFPQVICGIIIFINLILVVRALWEKQPPEPLTPEHREGRKQMGFLVLLTAGMLCLWGRIHFVALCGLYLAAVGWILKQDWKTFLPGSVVSAAVLYFIFHNLLNVML